MTRTLWIVAVTCVLAIALGCGKGGDGAKAAATQMLNALQKGDIGALLEGADLKTMYDQTPEEQRQGKSFDEWKANLQQQAEENLGTDFTFEVTGSEVVGDTTIVKIKVTQPGEEPEDLDIPFKQTDGKWKATPEGFGQIMMMWL
jgi:hypothetical protein